MPRAKTPPTIRDLVQASDDFGKKRQCCGEALENSLPVSIASVMLTHGFPMVDRHELDFPKMLENLNVSLNGCGEEIRVLLKQNLMDIAAGI